VREALYHAGVANNYAIDVDWVYSGDLEQDKGWDRLAVADGIIVPGGFGYRGVEGKIRAARWARENKVPYLGLCLGMQVMCVEFARHVMGWENANSTEFDDTTDHPVIDLMIAQRGLDDMGGTMRLGHYPCVLKPDTLAAEAYGIQQVSERHRHRWELNNVYREQLEAAGMRFSGCSPDGLLVEIAELEEHPFMVGSQFHPEFQSRPNQPHPLFDAFIRAASAYRERRLSGGQVEEARPDGSHLADEGVSAGAGE
jgi:CTP synthase